MNKKEIIKLKENKKIVYTYKKYFNGDLVPIKGYIKNYFTVNYIGYVDIQTEIGTLHNINIENIFLENNLNELKQKIKEIELKTLPEEIKRLEIDLNHKKRKLKRYKESE